MRLLDDEKAFDSGKSSSESLRLHWQQQSGSEQADVDAGPAQALDSLARCPSQRAPGDDGKLAIAFDGGPVIAIGEPLELGLAFIKLRAMVAFAASRGSELVVGKAVGGILATARAGNSHWRDAPRCHGVAFVDAGKFHRLSAL